MLLFVTTCHFFVFFLLFLTLFVEFCNNLNFLAVVVDMLLLTEFCYFLKLLLHDFEGISDKPFSYHKIVDLFYCCWFVFQGYQGMVDGGDLIAEASWEDVSGILQLVSCFIAIRVGVICIK